MSDHKIVLLQAFLPRPKAFSWEVHEYMQITEDGCNRFKDLMEAETWVDIKNLWPDQDKMVSMFHERLDFFVKSCFSWKRVRRKNTDKPWISDALRKRRKAVFWLEGRSELWKRLDKAIKKTITFRKKQYKEKMTTKLEQCGNKNQWYSIYKFLASDEMPQRWSINELRPN